MAEQYHEDPAAPQNPPNSVPNRRVRRGTFWLYLGPLVALFAAVGFAIFYLTTRPPDRGAQGQKVWNATGTTGEIKPGGHSPDPVPESPEKEIEERGVVRDLSEPPLPGVRPELMLTGLREVLDSKPEQITGRGVDVQNVDVAQVKDARNFVVHQGNAKVAVVAPDGSPALHSGQRVNVIGTVEPDGAGGVRIRASRVDVHN